MRVSEMRGLVLVAVILAAGWSMGCSSSPADNGDAGSGGAGGTAGAGGSAGTGGTPSCQNNLDISGGFDERFNCATDGVCTEVNTLIFLDIRLDETDDDPSDGTDYTFCETGGLGPLCIEDPPGTFKFSGMGTICGSTFRWTALSPGNFTEFGTWEFSEGGDVFEKESTYTSIGGEGGGECTGNGRRGGGAVPPPVECELPPMD